MGWLFDSVTFVKNQNMNLEKNSKIKNPDSEEKISKWKIFVNEIRIVLWKCYHVIFASTKWLHQLKILENSFDNMKRLETILSES